VWVGSWRKQLFIVLVLLLLVVTFHAATASSAVFTVVDGFDNSSLSDFSVLLFPDYRLSEYLTAFYALSLTTNSTVSPDLTGVYDGVPDGYDERLDGTVNNNMYIFNNNMYTTGVALDFLNTNLNFDNDMPVIYATYELWINLNSTSSLRNADFGGAGMAVITGSSYSPFTFGVTQTAFMYNSVASSTSSSGGRSLIYAVAPQINTDYHVVVSIDNTTAILYVNGVNVANSTDMIAGISRDDDVVVGRGRWNSVNYWINGSISARIYEVALSPEEISILYEAGKNSYSAITRGLVAQYSGRDFTGTEASPVTILDTKHFVRNPDDDGLALRFNGSQEIDTGIILDTANNAYTWATWAYLDSSDSNERVLIGREDTFMVLSDAGLKRQDELVTCYSTLSQAVSKNISGGWHHIACVHNPITNTLTMYHNGELVGSAAKTGNYADLTNNLYIGSRDGSHYSIWPMSDVIILRRALNASEIALIYENGTTDDYPFVMYNSHTLSTSNTSINTYIPSGEDLTVTVSSDENGGYYTSTFGHISANETFSLYQFRAVMRDYYNNNTINDFSITTTDGVFNSTAGLYQGNLGTPSSSANRTITITSSSYFPLTLNSQDVFTMLNTTLTSHILGVTVIEKGTGTPVTNYTINTSGYGASASNSTGDTLYLTAGNYTIDLAAPGYTSLSSGYEALGATSGSLTFEVYNSTLYIVGYNGTSNELLTDFSGWVINPTYTTFNESYAAANFSLTNYTLHADTAYTTSSSFVTLWEVNLTRPSTLASSSANLRCDGSGNTCEYRVAYDYLDGTTGYSDLYSRVAGGLASTHTFTGFNNYIPIKTVYYQARLSAGSAANGARYHPTSSQTNFTVYENLTTVLVSHGDYDVFLTAPGFAVYSANTKSVTVDSSLTSASIGLYSSDSFNITFYDETTDLLWNTSTVYYEVISTAQAFSGETTTGAAFYELLTPASYEIRYWADAEVSRSYYVTLTNNSYENLRLYLIPVNDSSFYIPVVSDANSQACADQTVSLLRYFVDINGYRVVEMAKTDTNGRAILRVIPNTVNYKLYFNGDCGVYMTNPEKIITSTARYTVTSAQTFFTSSDSIAGALINITYNNVTRTYVFNWADSTNVVTRGCLYVYKTYQGVKSTNYSGCLDASTGSLIYTLPVDVNNTVWSSQGVLHTNTDYSTYTFRGVDVSFLDSVARWGLAGVFWGLILLLGIVMAASHSSTAIVFSAVGTLAVLITVGIIAGGPGVVVGLIILGGVMLYKLKG